MNIFDLADRIVEQASKLGEGGTVHATMGDPTEVRVHLMDDGASTLSVDLADGSHATIWFPTIGSERGFMAAMLAAHARPGELFQVHA